MTEPVQPGSNTPAAEPTPAAPSGDSAPAFGTFGSTRGSGLARGKRSVQPSAAPAASSGEYKPTALEVITPEREYKNPFGGPSELPTPQPAAPAAAEVPPAPVEAPKAQEPAVEAPKAPAPAAIFSPAPAPEPAPEAEAPAPAAKPELNILPQAEMRRPAVSWEHGPSSGPRQGGPERDSRGFRDERRPREGRRDERPSFRPEQPHREHEHSHGAPSQPKPRGFFAWLKGLFGSKPSPTAQPEGRREERSFDRSGEGDGHRRRRRRGGRGRSFGERRFEGGERQDRPQDGPGGERRFEGGDRREGEGGNRRPRHRGGRGRGRGGDYRGPRPEGQQGGGAI